MCRLILLSKLENFWISRIFATILFASLFVVLLSSRAYGQEAKTSEQSDVLQIEHVTTVDEDPQSVDGDAEEKEAVDQSTDSGDIANPDDTTEMQEESIDDVGVEDHVSEDGQTDPIVNPTKPVREPMVEPELKAPSISYERGQAEELTLRKLVHELEYGSLTDSIKLLEYMVLNYPYDPDYRSLLAAARNLNTADIWYRYQRRLQLPPPSAKADEIQKMIKMPRKEKPINSLKQTTWFLLIKKNKPN